MAVGAAVRSGAGVFSNISAAAWTAGRYDEGRWAAERAGTNTDHVGALNNLGFNLRSLNDITGSLAAFDRALQLAPSFDYARWNRTSHCSRTVTTRRVLPITSCV